MPSKGKTLPIYGDGLNVRDWIHVEDHCRGLDVVLHQGKEGEVYNIGGQSEKTNLSVAKTILDHLGKPHSLIRFVTDRPGHDRRYAIDFSKIEKDAGMGTVDLFRRGDPSDHRLVSRRIRSGGERSRPGEYLDYYQRMYGNR